MVQFRRVYLALHSHLRTFSLQCCDLSRYYLANYLGFQRRLNLNHCHKTLHNKRVNNNRLRVILCFNPTLSGMLSSTDNRLGLASVQDLRDPKHPNFLLDSLPIHNIPFNRHFTPEQQTILLHRLPKHFHFVQHIPPDRRLPNFNRQPQVQSDPHSDILLPDNSIPDKKPSHHMEVQSFFQRFLLCIGVVYYL